MEDAIIRRRVITSRSRRWCARCGRSIGKDERYCRYSQRVNGSAKDITTCYVCADLIEACRDLGEPVGQAVHLLEFATLYTEKAEEVCKNLEERGWRVLNADGSVRDKIINSPTNTL